MNTPERHAAQLRANQELRRREREHVREQRDRQDDATFRLTMAYKRLIEPAQRCGAPLKDLHAEPETLYATLLGHPLRATDQSVQRRLMDGSWETLRAGDWVTLPSLPAAPAQLPGQAVPRLVGARLHRVTLLTRIRSRNFEFFLISLALTAGSWLGVLIARSAPDLLSAPLTPTMTTAFQITELLFQGLVMLWGVVMVGLLLTPLITPAQTSRLTRDLDGLNLLPPGGADPRPGVPQGQR